MPWAVPWVPCGQSGGISTAPYAWSASGSRTGAGAVAPETIHEGASNAQPGSLRPNRRNMYDIVRHAVGSPRRALSASAVIAKSKSRRPSAAGPSAKARPTAVAGSSAAARKHPVGRMRRPCPGTTTLHGSHARQTRSAGEGATTASQNPAGRGRRASRRAAGAACRLSFPIDPATRLILFFEVGEARHRRASRPRHAGSCQCQAGARPTRVPLFDQTHLIGAVHRPPIPDSLDETCGLPGLKDERSIEKGR
jgi:hypothetical protein